MAYNITGTAGNDTLNQHGDTGPGTIIGLAGNDSILTGSGLVVAYGNSGADTVLLQSGNTGNVYGGFENDSICTSGAIGTMGLLGNEGADTIDASAATALQNIVGGNDSNDGADSLTGGSGTDVIFGNGGNDTLNGRAGANVLIGGFGQDSLYTETGFDDYVFGNEGDDTINSFTGNDSVWMGQGHDSIGWTGDGNPIIHGNEGHDTVFGIGATGNMSVSGGNTLAVGGSDSADASDYILTGSGNDFIYGSGGADTIDTGNGSNTVAAGLDADSVVGGTGNDILFGNEGDDTLYGGFSGSDTLISGSGRDSILGGAGRDSIHGGVSGDTIQGGGGADTIFAVRFNEDFFPSFPDSDVFVYGNPSDDGDNGSAGGPLEFLGDVDFNASQDHDRFHTAVTVTDAMALSNVTGANLAERANNALAATHAQAGGGAAVTAAQFTFQGRTYLAIDQFNVGSFADADDLLLDITGVHGVVDRTNFF
jgi:serralysin